MSNKLDQRRNAYMLTGSFRKKGYDWWWHSFTAQDELTGEEKPFFIEFFLCNPESGGITPVFGQLPENLAGGVKPSYLMVKAGTWGKDKVQLHRFFGWESVFIEEGAPYSVKASDCYASDTALRGSVSLTEEDVKQHPEYMCDAGTMRWDLHLDKKIAFNVGYGAGAFFRSIKAFEMYWHAEGMKTLYRGTVWFNGRRYTVKPETSFGYADKNWGRGFTSPWVWLSSCCLESNLTGKKLENSAFDIGGGRPKVFFVPLERKLLSSFCYEGKEYEFNFSKFWTKVTTEFSCDETPEEIVWYVKQESRTAIMETEVRCAREDMLWVNYEAPDGSRRHTRLWNGGNGTGNIRLYEKDKDGYHLIDDMTATHIGCEYGEYDK